VSIRLGIVGCGEVTQVMHLPSLRLLGPKVSVSALCDTAPGLVDVVGERWGVAKRLTDWRDLLADRELDAVLVAGPHVVHAPIVLAALETGKHVLVEKPMCLTLREADAIVAAQQASGLVVQVGYMRRYATAFLEALREISSLGPIRLARVHDVLGLNELIGEQANHVLRVGPRIDSPIDAPTAALLEEAAGSSRAGAIYHFLLTLVSHDLSAMRELLGLPDGVLYAAVREGGESPYVTAAFDYGSFVCHLETGFDRIPRADQHIKVFGDEATLEVRFDTGFVRNLPIVVETVRATAGGGVERRVVQPDWGDPYVEEWRAFTDSVVEGAPCRTGPADARADLELALAVVRALPRPVTS
jgi:predicted dehydrogenase